jgi:hypothetical protein
MPEMFKGSDLVWEAAYELKEDSIIEVMYSSRRTSRTLTVTGKPDRVVADADGCRIDFYRDDGQKMIIDRKGDLLSVGSHFPVTGKVLDIDVTQTVE